MGKRILVTGEDAILMLLKYVSPNQRIVYPTSNSGYGIGRKRVFCSKETPLNPVSLHGVTKMEAEKATLDQGNGVTLRLDCGLLPSLAWCRVCASTFWSMSSLGVR